MRAAVARDFSAILDRHGVEYVIVGGAAVRREYPSHSQEVDVTLLASSFASATSSVAGNPAVVSFSTGTGEMATGLFHSRFGLVRFDFLDPTAFSGRSSGDAFFRYVQRYRSVGSPDGRIALIPVVWYMRLVIEGDAWAVQVPKILRDVRAGAPWTLAREVRHIARRFGVEARIAERWATVTEAARIAGLAGAPGP